MAVARDAATFGDGWRNSQPASWNHTIAGANRVVYVAVGWIDFPTQPTSVSSVTFGGNAMASVGSESQSYAGAYTLKIQTFRLIAPPTGSQTVAVTMSSGCYGAAGSVSYTGVNQSTPDGTVATSKSTTGTPSTTVTGTTSGNKVFASCFFGPANGGWTAGQTLGFYNHNATEGHWGTGAEDTDAGGDKTMTWSGNSDYWQQMAFEILAAPPDGHPAAKRSGGIPHMHKIGGSLSGTGRMAW